MKITGNFTVSLYLSNVLDIKISTPETISSSCFIVNPCLVLKNGCLWNDKTPHLLDEVRNLMKLVNLDITQ
jgi:hypothetical protein